MTIEQLKEAHRAGAKIQMGILSCGTGTIVWADIDDPAFDDQADRYRIKPKEEDK